jgi:DDE superfamily endonuclease
MKYLELYSDYLICNAGSYATATGLSAMMEGNVSHDQITRFLSGETQHSKDLWLKVKSVVREIEAEEGVLIFDDSIAEKEWTDESDLICWHYDHCKNRNVKGINLLSALYYANDVSIPVAFELITKPERLDKNGVFKRKSEKTKNALLREMLDVNVRNQLKFLYVLIDNWFASQETFEHILKHEKHFVAALKSNRLVALSLEDKKEGRFVHVNELELSDKQAVRGYLKGFDYEVLFVRRIFKNKDGSTGRLDLVCSDLTCDGQQVATIYEKRWKVEEYHKSLKSNLGLTKSPTRTMTTQNNHVFMSLYGFFKLECLKIKHRLNHFALRAKLLIRATQMAYAELAKLQTA